MKLTSSQRQAIINLPKALFLECFPEGIEREDFVDSRKEVSTEEEVVKGKKTRARKVSKQSETAKMGRSECFCFKEFYRACTEVLTSVVVFAVRPNVNLPRKGAPKAAGQESLADKSKSSKRKTP